MHTESTFTTPDGITIHTVKWTIEVPRAVVIIVHGIAEHSARYAHVAEHLNGHGYSVYSLDHRSHGKSGGDDPTHFDDFEHPVQDLKQYFDLVRDENPDIPIFLYGHSMGALISTLFVLKHQGQLAGFISSGTPLSLDEAAPSIVVSIGSLLGKLMPKLRLFPVDASAISTLPEEVRKYENDPLNDRQNVRVGMAAKLIAYGREARQAVHTIKIPLFIFHGGADTIAPPSGSKHLYENAGSSDKTLKIYDGMHHETHNDASRPDVLADLATWLDAHV